MKLCSLASGSSGNCIFAGTETSSVLIDTGISKKRIDQGLGEIGYTSGDMDAILITHEHSDHIKGLGVMARKLGLPIYATRGTIERILQTPSVGKIPEGLFREIRADRELQIGDLTIRPFSISHDAADPVGYRLSDGRHSMAVATDMGVYGSYIIEHLRNLDVLLLEANHDVRMLEAGVYPYHLKQRILSNRGHLSNEAAGQLLCEVLHDGLKRIILGHLSKENNYPALAYETVCSEITMGDNPYRSADFAIEVAKRDAVGSLIEL